ncbi:hypothetical protein WJX72_011796 [[Myrmecia] bisecta]|uniref:Glucose-6-phosphate isomerase n=1 Tax=[Myrmecia] bisecta TaxID=41462 RepID=A0AAW1PML4_9CHLO
MEWELSKENYQPLKQGRDPSKLNVKLQLQCKNSEVEEQRRAFWTEIAEYKGDDPLEVWLRFIKWTQETFKAGGHQAELVPLLERCTRELQGSDNYKSDVRYLRLWIQYENDIGQDFALYYIAYATYLELRGNFAKADAVFQAGVDRLAHPVDRLRSKFVDFQHRMAKRVQRKAQESAEAGLGLEAEPGPNRQAFSVIQSSASSAWTKLGSMEATRKENVQQASAWAGQKLAQKKALVPALAPALDIPVDEELVDQATPTKESSAPEGTLRQRLDRVVQPSNLDEDLLKNPLHLHKDPRLAQSMAAEQSAAPAAHAPSSSHASKRKKSETQAYANVHLGNDSPAEISFEEPLPAQRAPSTDNCSSSDCAAPDSDQENDAALDQSMRRLPARSIHAADAQAAALRPLDELRAEALRVQLSSGLTLHDVENGTRPPEEVLAQAGSPDQDDFEVYEDPAASSAAAAAGPLVDPFDPALQARLLQDLEPALEQWDDVSTCSASQASKAGELLRRTKRSLGSKPTVLQLGQCCFQLHDCIGQGAFATVFDAMEIDGSGNTTSSPVALKLQAPACAWEFYICKALRGRATPALRSCFVDARRLFLAPDLSVLETPAGQQGTLQDLVNIHLKAGQRMEEVVVMYYTMELLRLVAELHHCHILHTDLKPDNLLLRNEGANQALADWQPNRPGAWALRGLTLIDFGRSVDLALLPEGSQFLGDSMTDAFRCIEMQEKRPWTYGVDSYGICAIVHCMLFGEYMHVVKAIDSAGEVQYRLRSAFKRYWATDLWDSLFTSLLHHSDTSSPPPCLQLLARFEAHLAAQPGLARKLRAELLKQCCGSARLDMNPAVASDLKATGLQGINKAGATSRTGICRAHHQRPKLTTVCGAQRVSLCRFGRKASQEGKTARDVSVAIATPMAVQTSTGLVCTSDEWKALEDHVNEIDKAHLRDLLRDEHRSEAFFKEHNGIMADFSRQRMTEKTVQLLLNLAKKARLQEKIEAMFSGEHINSTEGRAVLHVALRSMRDEVVTVDGSNVVPEVWGVLDKIRDFSDAVRNGKWLGVTGKPLTDVVAIGIGGSFLGPLFVHTALRTDQEAANLARGRNLRFLANVDPVDVARALNALRPETTLVVVVSKTFTTAETMLNARTVRTWLQAELGPEATAKHMVAVSTNLKLVKEFGINPDNAFAFWDWVGGRYSVCSAVGMVPLALQYGFDLMEQFLAGAHDVDQHFRTAPLAENIPVMMGLSSIWNVSFLGYPARAILPYCQALSKLAPHIQQVSMESNGKGVAIDGQRLPFEAGEIDFGEPGTNGQHSFYQLIHQGRVVPCEFIGVVKSQQSVYLRGEVVSNHDELMCNFFAQADALANGKTAVELRAESVPDSLIPHKTFTGNRPSLSVLLPELTAFTVGQILALYENRVAVQGFVWGINSFDQWGVELGKVLASKVRTVVNTARTKHRMITPADGFNHSTQRLLNRYLEGKAQLLYPEPRDVFPCDLIDSEHCRPPTSYV